MNIPIWPGSSSFSPGETPFGFYDNDLEFEKDADKVAKFCSQRLGYPIVDVELQDIQFYTAFEEAVTTPSYVSGERPKDNLTYIVVASAVPAV